MMYVMAIVCFHVPQVEYSVSMVVTTDTLELECENRSLDRCVFHLLRVNNFRWRATFTAKFVEEITHRTGNFKSFSVFVKMLSSAFDSDSSAVNLDLLTSEDLEALRQASGVSSLGVRSDSTKSKRYLILTYQGEFDKVHYPMALSYTEIDDVIDLKRTIVQLRDELDNLRNKPLPVDPLSENLTRENDRLSKELNTCLLENSRLMGLVDALQRDNQILQERSKNSIPRKQSLNRRPPTNARDLSPNVSIRSRRDVSPSISIRSRRDVSPLVSRPPLSRAVSPLPHRRNSSPYRDVSPSLLRVPLRTLSPSSSPSFSKRVPPKLRHSPGRASVPMSEVDARLEALQNFLRHQKMAVN